MLGPLGLPSMLEPQGLYRTELVCDVTIVDAIAPSPLSRGFLVITVTAATFAESRKVEKYQGLIDNRGIFQLVALEVEPCSEVPSFFQKMFRYSHDD